MSDFSSIEPNYCEFEGSALSDIRITAQGDRRKLEAIYLELRELAKKNGLKIEYRLSVNKPESQS